MSEQKFNENKNNKEEINISPKDENKSYSSFKNLKRIRKDLICFAKNEILNIKKSKKDINVANFEEEKEVIAPSKYSLTTKKIQLHSNKQFTKDIEPVEEKIENDKKKEENNKNEKNEVSSSDISDDEEE